MKKLIFLILNMVLLFANTEKVLFETLFVQIFHKNKIKIYTKPQYEKFIKKSSVFVLVNECNKSDLVFGVYEKNCSKPIFVLDYYVYKKHPDILGAFYWRKGRPQLRLRKKIIKKFNLYFSKDFEDFLE